MSIFLKNGKVNKNVLGYLETAHPTSCNGLLFPDWCLEFAEQTAYWSTPFTLVHVTAHAGTPSLPASSWLNSCFFPGLSSGVVFLTIPRYYRPVYCVSFGTLVILCATSTHIVHESYTYASVSRLDSKFLKGKKHVTPSYPWKKSAVPN